MSNANVLGFIGGLRMFRNSEERVCAGFIVGVCVKLECKQ
jgi:hypothetical protein